MTSKPESRLQRRIQEALKKGFPGCVVYKIHGNEFQIAGIPDLLCCIEGRFIGLEVKCDDGEPTLVQQYELKRIKEAGGISAVVYNPTDAIHVVRKALARTARSR